MTARPPDMTADELARLLLVLAGEGRRLVAIAGPPGSGKSTLSEWLANRLDTARPGSAAVVPMDGFHYDDVLLVAQGTLSRKGAPSTFDAGGLAALLRRLHANEEPAIAIPVFDRSLEISRAGARLIARTTPLILVEGNYLLLDQEPWSALRPFFHLTIRLIVPAPELERRLIDRWLRQGLSRSVAEARARSNDLVNALLVEEHSVPADVAVRLG